MRAVLDIKVFNEVGHIDYALARFVYGVFLIQDSEGNTFVAVKNGDKVEKIRLEDETKDVIKRIYEESQEKDLREKQMEEFKELILRVCKRTEKIESFLNLEVEKAFGLINKIVEKYIRETYLSVAEMKKQKDEAKEKEPLSEDCFKGFISEAALERIIREIVSKKEA